MTEQTNEQNGKKMIKVQIPNEVAYAALLAGRHTVRVLDEKTYTFETDAPLVEGVPFMSGGTQLMLTPGGLVFPTQTQPEKGMATFQVMLQLAYATAMREIEAEIGVEKAAPDEMEMP